MIIIERDWETVFITASKKGRSETVELSVNRNKQKFNVVERHQEGIRFDSISLESAKLKVRALNESMKYIEKAFNEKS